MCKKKDVLIDMRPKLKINIIGDARIDCPKCAKVYDTILTEPKDYEYCPGCGQRVVFDS